MKISNIFWVGIALLLLVCPALVGCSDATADECFRQGTTYLEAGNYEKAIDAFEQTIRLDPEYVRAYFALGVTYYEEGRYDDAIAVLERYIELTPGDPNDEHDFVREITTECEIKLETN